MKQVDVGGGVIVDFNDTASVPEDLRAFIITNGEKKKTAIPASRWEDVDKNSGEGIPGSGFE